MGKTVQFECADGQCLQGYLAEPAAAAGARGVVVIQAWWALNDQIRAVAHRYAAAGYTAPDFCNRTSR